ncbi:hypothetical protein [Kitasatospora herbaricolor]
MSRHAESITPERARSTFRHPENADRARAAVAAVDELAQVDVAEEVPC